MRADILAVLEVANGVGESPVWDEGVLRWVDITGRAVHALSADGVVSSHVMPDFPCFLALRRGGGAVVGLPNRLSYLDLVTGELSAFSSTPVGRS